MSVQIEYVNNKHESDNNNNGSSLFPTFDIVLLYTPTYILKNRPSPIHRIIILLTALSVVAVTGLTLWLFWSITSYVLGVETSGFIVLMFILILIPSGMRLHFFIYKFDFNLWQQQKHQTSFILRQNQHRLDIMCKRFRIGCFFFTSYLFIIFIMRLFIHFQVAAPELFHTDPKKLEISYQSIIWALSMSFVQQFGQQIPDCLMMIVGRLYFTECHLAIVDYTKQLKSMSPKQIIMADMHGKYLKMREYIDGLAKPFKWFVLCQLITLCWLCWYLLTVFTTVAAAFYETAEISIQNQVLFSLYAVYNGLLLIFTLWPAFRMTELFDELKITVDDKINQILKNRVHFNDKRILNPLMDSLNIKEINITNETIHSVLKKELNNLNMEITNRENTMSLKTNVATWSEQKSAFDILMRLVSTMEDKSCAYRVFGLPLDRYSIRNFIIGLFVGKIFALMWG